MPNRPPPSSPKPPQQVTLLPGAALAASFGIDQVTPGASSVQITGPLPVPASGSTPVTMASAPLPLGAAQEGGNLQDVLMELRRMRVLLSALLAATGNGVPDQDEIDAQLTGGTPWPQ